MVARREARFAPRRIRPACLMLSTSSLNSYSLAKGAIAPLGNANARVGFARHVSGPRRTSAFVKKRGRAQPREGRPLSCSRLSELYRSAGQGACLLRPSGASAMCFLRTSQCFGWHGSKIRLLPFPGVAGPSTHHGADGLADFRELCFRDVACHPADDAAAGSDQPMRQKETLLRQSTGEKI
jgi:hypothetical protein